MLTREMIESVKREAADGNHIGPKTVLELIETLEHAESVFIRIVQANKESEKRNRAFVDFLVGLLGEDHGILYWEFLKQQTRGD